VDGLEIPLPGKQLSGVSSPELVGLGDGFIVECLVLVEACIYALVIPAGRCSRLTLRTDLLAK
jgi:hypothetical protein